MKFPWDNDNGVHKSFSNVASSAKPSTAIFDEMGQFNFKTSPDLEYEVKKYPDGSQYVSVGGGTQLTFKLDSYNDLWTLNQINDVLVRQRRTISLCIPNLIDAQADRRFNTNQSAGLKTVCKMLNDMKGFYQIQVFHPHNPEVVEALIDNVNIIDNFYFIKEVMEEITDTGDYTSQEDFESKLVLMSSDAGGFKPLMKLADKLQWKGETYSASKSRKYEDGHSKLTQIVDRQDFGGKDILIVDDLCIYGGTFKGLAKLLKERNCGKLYLTVSHLTIKHLGPDPVTDYFDKVFTTNSKFDEYVAVYKESRNLYNPQNLEIIKLF